MTGAALSEQEFLWREWVLGEGRYDDHNPRDMEVRPNVGYGAKGQDAVPDAWWARLEEFLIRRSGGDPEPDRKVPIVGRVKARIPQPVRDDVQLSPHFNVREFDCHNGAKVPKIAIPALRKLCLTFLEPMRAKFGPAHVLSGYRPRAYNASIGGAKFSQHIYELTPSSVAADTMYARGNPAAWAREARRIADRRKEGGVGQYNGSGFVHTDNGPRRDWWG